MNVTSSLDTQDIYQRYDPTNMLARIAGLPDQCQEAWDRASALRLPASYTQADRIVFLGMGGSAIGGDLVAGLAQLHGSAPVTVQRDFSAPLGVGPSTLVIASSYSGNTEETLAMYRQARERKAMLVAMTSGGTLTSMAGTHRTPVYAVPYKGEPRSALGHSIFASLALLCRLGLLPYTNEDVAAAIQVAKELAEGLSPAIPTAQNLGKSLAEELCGKLPIVYGGGFLTGVARRWKTQLNENSKSWAFYEEIPEAAHNAVEGYSLPQAIAGSAYVVLLHSYLFHNRLSARYTALEDLLQEHGVPCRQIDAAGDTPLAHLLTSVLLGDHVSYYLALLNGVNPASNEAIDHLKAKLARE